MVGQVNQFRLFCSGSLLVVGLVWIGGTVAVNQQFRSRTDLVRIDVTVIDEKTGRPVVGLTEADFVLFEDDERQRISSFVAESGQALGGDNTAERGDGGRTFLLILGAGTREGTSDPYGGIVRFIRQSLRKGDRAAIMVWDRVTPFTSDFAALARLVERRKRIPSDVISLAQVDSQSRQEFSSVTRAAIDRWLLPAGEPQDFLRAVAPLVLGTPEVAQDPLIWQRLDSHIAASDLLKVAAGIELLRHQSGEKRLVLVSLIGLAIPMQFRNYVMLRNSDQERSLAARAADAGVAVDLITTYGTMNPPSLAWSLALQSARQLAAEAGGEFTSLRTVEQQLARVDESSVQGYIIGYMPTTAVLDGKRRKVSISVKKKDVSLIYRRTYSAHAEPPAQDYADYISRTRIEDAAAAPVDLVEIGIKATARTTDGTSGSHLRVDMTLDVSRLSLPVRNGIREGLLDIMVVCGNSRRETIGRKTQRVALSLDEKNYGLALRTGIPHTIMVPIKGRVVEAKVIAYSVPDDRLGSVSLTVR